MLFNCLFEMSSPFYQDLPPFSTSQKSPSTCPSYRSNPHATTNFSNETPYHKRFEFFLYHQSVIFDS